MIYIECKPDLALVKRLTGVRRKEIIHEFKGKGEICNKLRNRTNGKGLVDEDPDSAQPSYIRQMVVVEGDLSEHDIKVLYDSKTKNRLIVLCPTLEEWILGAARQASIDVGKYGLPNNARKLHSEINISLDKFDNLLQALKDSSRLKTLKRLLEQ